MYTFELDTEQATDLYVEMRKSIDLLQNKRNKCIPMVPDMKIHYK